MSDHQVGNGVNQWLKHEVCRVWLEQTQAKIASRLSNERRAFILTTLVSLIGVGAWVYWEYAVLRSGDIEKAISVYVRLSKAAGWIQLVIPAALILNYFFAYFRFGTFISDIWAEDVPERYEYISFNEFWEFLGIALFLGLWIMAALFVSYITAIAVCTIGLLFVIYWGFRIKQISLEVVYYASKWDQQIS